MAEDEHYRDGGALVMSDIDEKFSGVAAIPAKGYKLEGEIDGSNNEFNLPEVEGEFILCFGGQVLTEGSQFTVEEGKVLVCSPPDYETERPVIYFVK